MILVQADLYLFGHDADVTSCEPDVRVSIDTPSAKPDDPDYPQQWNMADIQMPTLWGTNQFGNTSVLTCVIDTGVDYTHADLIQNLWVNEVEMNGPGATAANGYKNGIDDDNNGDFWNFVQGLPSASSSFSAAQIRPSHEAIWHSWSMSSRLFGSGPVLTYSCLVFIDHG